MARKSTREERGAVKEMNVWGKVVETLRIKVPMHLLVFGTGREDRNLLLYRLSVCHFVRLSTIVCSIPNVQALHLVLCSVPNDMNLHKVL